jgi:hypothetical protein
MARAVTHARPHGQARLIETAKERSAEVKMPADGICAASKSGVRHVPMAALAIDYITLAFARKGVMQSKFLSV